MGEPRLMMRRIAYWLPPLLLTLACGSEADSGDDDTNMMVSEATGSASSAEDGTSDEDGQSESSTGDASASDATSDSSTSSSDTTDTTSSDSGPVLDVGSMTTAETTGDDCLECSLAVSSQQSGVLEVLGGDILGTAELMNEIVYVVGNYGAGRFIAVADSAIPMNEVTDCPLYPWLADTNDPDPAMLVFGWAPGDGPAYWQAPNQTVSDIHLPAQYVGNPAQIRADFDIVLYLESSSQNDGGDEPTDEEMQTLLDYVNLHGGGLYISSEFSDSSGVYISPDDRDSVNRLLNPLGVNQPEFSLNWGDVDGNIEFECFPPVD